MNPKSWFDDEKPTLNERSNAIFFTKVTKTPKTPNESIKDSPSDSDNIFACDKDSNVSFERDDKTSEFYNEISFKRQLTINQSNARFLSPE